jgi:hypothetical protein
LLGDEHLEVPLRLGVAKDLGEGRVGDLAVHRDDVAARLPERRERFAVGLACCDLLADLVARQLGLVAFDLEGAAAPLRLRDLHGDVRDAAELLDRLVGVV